MFTELISGMSFYDIAACFALYSIVGFALEVIYAALVLGKFVNRGFLAGPWCPIYGFGLVVVSLLLKPVSSNLAILFVGSIIVATLIELVVGIVLERVFGLKWWDYTDEPFNVGGYICLKFSLLWGIACVFVVRLILPLTDMLIELLRGPIGIAVFFGVIALMLADTITTVISIVGIKRKVRLLGDIASRLRARSDRMGEFLSSETLELKERFDALSEQVSESRFSKRIRSAFPKLEREAITKRIAELKEELGRELRERFERDGSDEHPGVQEHIQSICSELVERLESPTKQRAVGAEIIRLTAVFLIGAVIGFIIAEFIVI